MGLRTDWKFGYSAATVADAADKKVTHHLSRLEFWTKQQETVKAEIRETGIDIKESAAGASYASNAAYGAQITVDAGMQRDLNECFVKINEHREKVETYGAFAAALHANGDEEIPLDVDDITFFFGK